MNRIAILIDGNNFYKGCQLNFNRTDVDFRKLGQKLADEIEGELLRIYYYNAHVSKSIDPLGYQRQQKFFDNLRATPFITLKLGHLVYHRLRNEQGFSSQYFPTEKGIDVQIAVDMIRLGLLKACDGIILVSGDSDYIYAVRFAKDLGSNVYIASFPMGGSTELRNEGDGSILMDLEFVKDCFIRSAPYYSRDTSVESRIVDAVPTYSDRYRTHQGFSANSESAGPGSAGAPRYNQRIEPTIAPEEKAGYRRDDGEDEYHRDSGEDADKDRYQKENEDYKADQEEEKKENEKKPNEELGKDFFKAE